MIFMHAVYSVLQKRHKMTALKKKKGTLPIFPLGVIFFNFLQKSNLERKNWGRGVERKEKRHIFPSHSLEVMNTP